MERIVDLESLSDVDPVTDRVLRLFLTRHMYGAVGEICKRQTKDWLARVVSSAISDSLIQMRLERHKYDDLSADAFNNAIIRELVMHVTTAVLIAGINKN